MKDFVVRYKLKADRVEENENLVKAMFSELAALAPSGISYTCFKMDDGVSFMHVVHQDSDDNPITELSAFKKFSENIAERCEIPPKPSDLQVIGSYKSS